MRLLELHIMAGLITKLMPPHRLLTPTRSRAPGRPAQTNHSKAIYLCLSDHPAKFPPPSWSQTKRQVSLKHQQRLAWTASRPAQPSTETANLEVWKKLGRLPGVSNSEMPHQCRHLLHQERYFLRGRGHSVDAGVDPAFWFWATVLCRL